MLDQKDIDGLFEAFCPGIQERDKEKVLRWSEAITHKDPFYPAHVKNVCHYSASLGLSLSLSASQMELLLKGALLHDIGKVTVPRSILAKPGPLTPKERARMRHYCLIGEKFCQSLPYFREASFLVRCHHERLDGSGYPDGLRGEQIPLLGRILSVADVFDALRSERVYKHSLSLEVVLSHMTDEVRMGLLDGTVVDHLNRLASQDSLSPGHLPDPSTDQASRSVDDTPVEVLITEDNEDLRSIMTTVVRAMGLQSHTAANGEEGLCLLHEYPGIGIVLLDLMMPEMDGFSFCRRVQADPDLKELHIVIVSARASPDDKITGFRLGAADYITKPFNMAELRARVAVGERIVRQQRALKAQRSLLETMVREDRLTGLCSRRFFEERLGEEWARAARYRRPLSIIMGDLDHFKQINDRYGHPVGDRVLADVGGVLRRDLRQSDIAARYGGEEFVLLLPETEQGGAHLMAQRLRSKIKELTFAHVSSPFSVTISFGVATACFPSFLSPGQLLVCADRALYAAKHGGCDRVEIFRGDTV